MILQDLVDALELPASCRVDQRIPKKLLIENGVTTAADKRNITEGIEEIQWVATLKPTSIGVPEYRDEIREYLEIAVLHIALRQDAKASRIAELTHRAVPYPILLLLTAQDKFTLSMAHIRWAQNEVGKVVLDGETVAVALDEPTPSHEVFSAFFHALSIIRQPREDLKVLYQGWLDTLAAFQAAQITGVFTQRQSDDQAVTMHASLLACRELKQQIAALRGAATKEKQINRQVALNIEIKKHEAELNTIKQKLVMEKAQ